TPGRLLDHIKSGALALAGARQILLDEADQMLDMGFREELEGILDAAPAERRTHLVSATFPPAIRKLATSYQHQPLHVEGTRLGEANADIEHIVHLVHHRDRYAALVNLLLLQQGERTLVFVATRAETAELAEKLAEDGFSATAISGDLPQNQRNRTLAAFRAGTLDVMVATDVAARGLDIPDVSMVVHAAAPRDAESYIHRSGRTGRAGSQGKSVLLAPNTARYRVERLLSLARIDARWHPAPDAKAVAKKLTKKLRKEVFDALRAEPEIPEKDLEYAQRLVTENDPARVAAVLLARLQDLQPTQPRELGARPPQARDEGAFHRDAPHRESPRRPTSGPRPDFEDDRRTAAGQKPRRSDRGDWVPFSINWGFRRGATTRRLLAHVCRRGEIHGGQIGAIDVGPNGSSFEVAAAVAAVFEQKASRPDERDPHLQILPLAARTERRPPGPRKGSDRGTDAPNRMGRKATYPKGAKPQKEGRDEEGRRPPKAGKGRPPDSGRKPANFRKKPREES
ncbi:MAG: DEAD/DEAH box helicase, partial [Acidobacteria bacterium]|nr:DEAD/DEAH box helicase [Acidobacteriota bacterium]